MFGKDKAIIVSLAVAAFYIFYIGSSGFSSLGGGGGSGCGGAQFVTLATTAECLNERVLTGTVNQITVTDNGAGSTVVLSLPQAIALTSSPQFTDLLLTGQLNLDSSDEYLRVDAPATVNLSTRDNVVVRLDTNNNSASDFCIQQNGVATDTFCIAEDGTVTLATIDGDDNTIVDIGWGDLDFVDSPADEECVTIEGADDFEAQPCGSGGFTYSVDLPVPSGSTTANSNYSGVPGTALYSSGGEFITANDIYVEMFTVSEDITINRVSMWFVTAANPSDSCRIGLYDADAQWQPGTLVADWGTVASDSTGYHHLSVSTTVTAGNYVKVFLCDSAAAPNFWNTNSDVPGVAYVGTTSSTNHSAKFRVSSPSGTQHASGFASSGDDWDTIDLVNIGNNYHAIVLRWSTS